MLQSSAQQLLRKRVLTVLARMLTSEEAGMPSPRSRIQHLQQAGQLNICKLLDIAALYSASAASLIQRTTAMPAVPASARFAATRRSAVAISPS